MFQFSLRTALLGAVLLPLLAAPSFAAVAATPQPMRALAAAPRHGRDQLHFGSAAPGYLAAPHTAPHFLYVDDGELFSFAESISGYQITRNGLVPTPGSPYPTGGQQNPSYIGSNYIATSPGSSSRQPCVFHIDGRSKQVESFAVAPTGALTEVSSVILDSVLEASLNDVQVSADGNYVYVTEASVISPTPPSYLHVLTVGSSCSLTLVSSIEAPNRIYISIAPISSTQLMGTDMWNNSIAIYQITHGTKLTLLSLTPAQVFAPAGAAAGHIGAYTLVFNGGTNVSFESEGEVHTVNAQGILGSVPGSPARDPNGRGGEYVLFDHSHNQMIESDEASNALGVYGEQGGIWRSWASRSCPTGVVPQRWLS
jgi:hypothetical protein